MKKFLEDLKKAMAERSLTQSELSRLSGVKQYNISKFLSGDRDILLSNAFKLWPFIYGEKEPSPPFTQYNIAPAQQIKEP